MRTWFTERFGLPVPVACAPMAGVGGGELAAAVGRAGGLGMVGVGSTTPASWIGEQCRLAAATGRPFGVGLMAWALDRHPEQLAEVLAARPALVSVSFGRYLPYVAPLQEAGIAVATQVGTLAEAEEAQRAGVDVIVARGGEAGGHGRNDVATLPLLQEVLDTVSTPVLAAGGLAGARGLAAVLAAGAAGGWIGTAFLACPEAATPPGARDSLLAASDAATCYGRVFDVAQRLDWPPEYGGRALRNAFFDRWSGREEALATDDQAPEQLRRARRDQDFDTAYIYAGQAVSMLRRARPAGEVIAELAGAEALLRQAVSRWSAGSAGGGPPSTPPAEPA